MKQQCTLILNRRLRRAQRLFSMATARDIPKEHAVQLWEIGLDTLASASLQAEEIGEHYFSPPDVSDTAESK